MTGTAALPGAKGPVQSPFAGADVCQEAGLSLPDGAPRPVFEDDLWDFTQVIGLPRQLSKVSRRFDFAAIAGASWQLVAKEQIMAMLAPRHDAVMPLPHAYRTPLHLGTAFGRLAELTRFLNWLASQGTTSLADIDEDCCEAWMAHRRFLLDDDGHVAGERSPATRRAAAQVVADWSPTGSCSPPTGSLRACGPGGAPLPRSSQRCPRPGRTRPRPSPTASCSRCWPRPST